jgi:hypothetical protein
MRHLKTGIARGHVYGVPGVCCQWSGMGRSAGLRCSGHPRFRSQVRSTGRRLRCAANQFFSNQNRVAGVDSGRVIGITQQARAFDGDPNAPRPPGLLVGVWDDPSGTSRVSLSYLRPRLTLLPSAWVCPAAGTTMIVVTHGIGFAREVANRMAFMEGGQILEGAPRTQFFTELRARRVQTFLSKILT